MKPLLVALTAGLLLTSGCAKNRWLSRRDYSEMQDPFAGGSELAAQDPDAGSTNKRDPGSGRARVNTLTADAGSDSAGALRGPKPLQPAGATSQMAGSVSNAAYSGAPGPSGSSVPQGARSYSGPELSDFLNGRTTATAPATAQYPAELTADPRSLSAGLPAAPAASRARITPASAVSAEADRFNDFLEQKSEQASGAIRQASGAAAEVVEEAEDFAAWAEQQRSTWTGTAKSAGQSARTEASRISKETRAAAAEASDTANDAASDFADTLLGSDSEAETAEPLLKPLRRTTTPKQPVTPAAEVNPFDDPFAGLDEDTASLQADSAASTVRESSADELFGGDPRAATRAAGSPSATGKPGSRTAPAGGDADSLFGSDTGWKPADLTRP
jgi:hypothetical protein